MFKYSQTPVCLWTNTGPIKLILILNNDRDASLLPKYLFMQQNPKNIKMKTLMKYKKQIIDSMVLFHKSPAGGSITACKLPSPVRLEGLLHCATTDLSPVVWWISWDWRSSMSPGRMWTFRSVCLVMMRVFFSCCLSVTCRKWPVL